MSGPTIPGFGYSRHPKVTKQPAKYGVPFKTQETLYGAIFFHEVCVRFIICWNHLDAAEAAITQAGQAELLMFNKVNVYHSVK